MGRISTGDRGAHIQVSAAARTDLYEARIVPSFHDRQFVQVRDGCEELPAVLRQGLVSHSERAFHAHLWPLSHVDNDQSIVSKVGHLSHDIRLCDVGQPTIPAVYA